MNHDPNDKELIESLKYLVLPTEEKLKLRSQAFDAKKACWIPDAKEVFIAGEITEVKGDQTVVKNGRGEVMLPDEISSTDNVLLRFRLSQSRPIKFNK